MLDPGALGTLKIGLDAIRAEQLRYDRAIPRTERPRRHAPSVRIRGAATSRHLAGLVGAVRARWGAVGVR